mmetsp:Transcript_37146/g.41905  ORF Transcript_37146/g.41905 Transcript_37146/m.41905 type:complete len:91 (-) Transcript_37146:919-1191(-)
MAIATVFGILLVTAIGVIAYALRQRFQSNGTSNSSSSSSSFLEEGNEEPPQKVDNPTTTTATTSTTIADVTIGGIGADVIYSSVIDMDRN